MGMWVTSTTEYQREKKQANIIHVCATDLTLLSLLGKNVADQCLLENVLFDQKMPKPSGWEGLVVLCPARENIRKMTKTYRTNNNNICLKCVKILSCSLYLSNEVIQFLNVNKFHSFSCFSPLT